MSRLLFVGCLLCFICLHVQAQTVELNYYLPDISYDPKIPTPRSVLGYQVGEWHVSHDQLAGYMYRLAEATDRISLQEYGRTYEGRPMLLLTITSEENHKNIEAIRKQHLALSDAQSSAKVEIDNMPTVVYQGYSIHGDEASGSNAALLMAYYLAAAQGDEVEKLLNNVVILFDPSLNPDGLQRFSGWVNSHKSVHASGDPANRELNEIWPTGRTNHYWFDLNRDWLPVQHPESQGRIKIFHQWRPNILTDHHEMGSNSTFFFQPGIPSRTNPMTPARNQELTGKIATFHAAELDKIGSTYYSEESFDDYYYGKGSTYPDINGCIGILFEQATAAGHKKESSNGLLTFPFAVRNQVATSFSTLKAAQQLRNELLEFQRDFYKEAWQEASDDQRKAYVFGAQEDGARLREFSRILQLHDLKVYELNKDLHVAKHTFKKGKAHVLPLQQSQYRLAKAIFERNMTFTDSLFYDVSAWTLPLAFDLDYVALGSGDYHKNLLGNEVSSEINKGAVAGGKSNYAYLVEWGNADAPKALYQLLDHDLIVKVANAPFTAKTGDGERNFEVGTLLVSVANQMKTADEIYDMMHTIASGSDVKIYAVSSGLTSKGIDFGSPKFEKVSKPEVLMLIGDGVSSNDAGEIWFTFDQRFEMPATLAEVDRFAGLNLSRYNIIVLANGSYGRLRDSGVEKLKGWLQDGGTLVVFNSAIEWASNSKLANVTFKSRAEDKDKKGPRAYNLRSNDSGSKIIGGAILEAQLDLSHPLCYGYTDSQLPVFRRGTLFMEPTENPYATPLRYTDTPLMSGYISKDNIEALKGTAAVTVSGIGRGRTISIVDNPLFRAFWHGGTQLFANAVFFGNTIDRGSTQTSMPAK